MIEQHIGPYLVLSKLGEGGMGEVYRARDTALNREVAIKVMPKALAGDPDRLARFQREAESLAALNHPNIAQVYGLERSGEVPAIVMELVEGRDLSEIIAAGSEDPALRRSDGAPGLQTRGIPIEDALAIARQITDALEAAHERGIIHRDLKPANIKVREDGTVKVLDFGLAKAMDPIGDASADMANSPTLTARATQMGMVLGTAAYMAPEQAKGKHVDKRADVWAFGVVLFEMLTGRQVFEGGDVSEVMAGVIKDEPPWDALPAATPRSIHRLLRRCLVKAKTGRLRDIGDARLEIDDAATEPGDVSIQGLVGDRPAAWRRVLPVVTAVVATTLVAGAAWYYAGPAGDTASADIMRFAIGPQGEVGLSLLPGRTGHVAISPDGRLLVYQGRRGTEPVLIIRRFEETEGAVLRGSEGGVDPFFSPGSDFVGFAVAGLQSLKRVSVNGGTAKEIARVDGRINGATWTDDGQVIVGVEAPGRALFSVSAEGGGSPVAFSDLEEDANLVRPSAIPGTRAVLFVSAPGAPGVTGQLMVLDRDMGVAKSLGLAGTSPTYLQSGHLLYADYAGVVMAVPFDVGRLSVTGTPVSVLAPVTRSSSGSADFSVSTQGRLVYIVEQEEHSADGALVWLAPDGTEEPIAAPVSEYQSVRISPDGTQLLADILVESSRVLSASGSSRSRIWSWDLTRPSLLRPWTTDTTGSERPVWHPDGTRMVYSDGINLYTRLADGTGDAVPLTQATDGRRRPNAVSKDGRVIFSYSRAAGTQEDLRMVSLDGDHAVTPLVQTDETEFGAALSPDGRWIAYTTREGQTLVVYVQPFPNAVGAPVLVSTGAGGAPVWSRDGRHLFYVAADNQNPRSEQLMQVLMQTSGGTLVPGVPAALFDVSAYTSHLRGQRYYDVAPDGRFVMIKPVVSQSPLSERPPPPISVVLNFFGQLGNVR